MSNTPDNQVSNTRFAARLERQAANGHGWNRAPEMMREAARRIRKQDATLTAVEKWFEEWSVEIGPAEESILEQIKEARS